MWRVKLACPTTMLLGALLFAPEVSRADDEPPPTKLILYPMDEPLPALKYRLLPPFLETTPGNAAVHYGKVPAEQTVFFSNQELWDNMALWRKLPLEELRKDEVQVPSEGSIDDSLARAARCRACDWQLPIGRVPYYDMLLPEVQQLRYFAWILATKARLQMAHDNFDQAIMTLQHGYALGRHTAAGETLVNGLVGIAICELASEQLTIYVQQPGAPNLYWALTDLPRPLIDMRRAFEVEATGVALNFLEVPDLPSAELSDDTWRSMLIQIANVITGWSSADEYKPPTPGELNIRCQHLHAFATRALIDGHFEEKRVQSMSPHQVAVLYTVTRHRLLLEEAVKHVSLPYPQAISGIRAAIEQANREQHIVPIAVHTLPAVQTARTAIARNERAIAVLRVIEALRIFAARRNGQLPARLEDITDIPVPKDPVTGRSFVYLRAGKTAFLRGPSLGDKRLSYEIEMVGSK